MSNFSLKHLFHLVLVNLKMRYRDTWVGFLWVILNPILIFGVQTLLFQNIFKNSTDEYLYYLLSGLLPWFFLTQTAEMSCGYLKSNMYLLRNLKMTPFFLISSLVIENFISYIFSSLFIFSFLLIAQKIHLTTVCVFYTVSLFYFFFVLALSFFLSYAHTLFKDVKYIIHFLFTLIYFLTPTFYFVNSFSPQLQKIIKLNPLFWAVSIFRIGTSENNGLSDLNCFIGFSSLLLATLLFTYLFTKKLHNKIFLKL